MKNRNVLRVFKVFMCLWAGLVFTACPSNPIPDNEDKEEVIVTPPLEDEIVTNQTNFLFTYICPDDIFEEGDVIITCQSNKGDEIKKTLTQDDFTKGNGEYVKTNVEGSKSTEVESGDMYWQLPLSFDGYDIEQTVLIQFQPKVSSYSFTSYPFFSVKTNTDSYQSPITIVSPTVIGISIGSEPNPADLKLFAGYKFSVDSQGKITAQKMSEDDLREKLNEEQRSYLTACVKSFFKSANDEIDAILAVPEDEEMHFIYSEKLPKVLFGKTFDIALELGHLGGMVTYDVKVKTGNEDKWTSSFRISLVEEVKDTLNDTEFIELLIGDYERKLLDKMGD